MTWNTTYNVQLVVDGVSREVNIGPHHFDIIIIIFIRQKHNIKAVIENCGQDKLGNSTYNCPKTFV